MVATAVCFTSVVACVTNVPALRESHSVQLQSKGDCTGQSCANEVFFGTSQSPQIFLKNTCLWDRKMNFLQKPCWVQGEDLVRTDCS